MFTELVSAAIQSKVHRIFNGSDSLDFQDRKYYNSSNFCMCGPDKLNQKCSFKYWINWCSILMHVFYLKLVSAKCPDEKPKSLL